MTTETRVIATARARLLDQYLTACPDCAEPAAAHVDRHPDGTPILVRFVCPNRCEPATSAVLDLLPTVNASLTA